MISARLIILCLLATTAMQVSAKQEKIEIKEDTSQVASWNRFVDNLYKLHKHIVKNFPTRTKEEMGGYGGSINDPQFYREVRSYHAENGRLISKIQWERKNPKNIHTMELYIYDTKGRIKREYAVSFLPTSRNAPIQALISMYNYAGQLEGFRQFDASGARMYEHCAGQFQGKKVNITFEEYELSRLAFKIPDAMRSAEYRSCFEGVPTSIGKYSNPMSEIPALSK